MGVLGDGEEIEEGSGAVDGDLRSALSDAFDNTPELPEAEEPSQDEVKAEPVETEEKPEADDSGRDERGRFKPKAQDQSVQAKPQQKEQLKDAQNQLQPGVKAAATFKPPQSWKPAAREKWAALPPEIQQEVDRREREMALGLNEAAEHKKNWGAFQQTVSPYLGMIQSEGGEPLKAVGSLLQTAAALRTAPPVHKAQLVAQMVRMFGVPVDALDSALAGQVPQPGHQQQYFDPNQFQQQITNGVLQTLKQQRDVALHQRGQQDIAEFEQDAEFIDDVREDMADLLDMAAKRGQQLTLQDAYNKAIALNPQLSEVLRQREEAKRAENVNASTQRAKQAARSIRSQPSGMTHVKEPDSVRDYLEAAWESASGR